MNSINELFHMLNIDFGEFVSLFFWSFTLNTFKEITHLPFLITSTIRLSQGRIFKIIHASNPLPLWTWRCRFYSTILFLNLRLSPLNINNCSKALIIQSSSLSTKLSFLHLSISSWVKSRFYLAVSLLSR